MLFHCAGCRLRKTWLQAGAGAAWVLVCDASVVALLERRALLLSVLFNPSRLWHDFVKGVGGMGADCPRSFSDFVWVFRVLQKRRWHGGLWLQTCCDVRRRLAIDVGVAIGGGRATLRRHLYASRPGTVGRYAPLGFQKSLNPRNTLYTLPSEPGTPWEAAAAAANPGVLSTCSRFTRALALRSGSRRCFDSTPDLALSCATKPGEGKSLRSGTKHGGSHGVGCTLADGGSSLSAVTEEVGPNR